MPTPDIKLNDGTTIPQLGFGVFQIPDAEAETAVRSALDAGYRSVDTAQGYGNERGVGHGLSGGAVPREQVYVTTKLTNERQGYDEALRALDESLEKLGLDQVDLYLIHWPCPGKNLYLETWKAFIKARDDGKVRSIGVSNFMPDHLDRIIGETGVVPVLNQVERHPHFQQKDLMAVHQRHGIATESWSPLGQAKFLDDAKLRQLADKHAKTPAQVALRWHVQTGAIVIPKSVKPARMAENAAIFDFELDDEDLKAIEAMETGKRIGLDPNSFG